MGRRLSWGKKRKDPFEEQKKGSSPPNEEKRSKEGKHMIAEKETATRPGGGGNFLPQKGEEGKEHFLGEDIRSKGEGS